MSDLKSVIDELSYIIYVSAKKDIFIILDNNKVWSTYPQGIQDEWECVLVYNGKNSFTPVLKVTHEKIPERGPESSI